MNECPECGSEDIEEWQEEFEVGQPLNAGHKPVYEAPRYRMKTIQCYGCHECGWSNL